MNPMLLVDSYKIHHTKMYLIVTHGIFSKGFEELSKYFDGIYCTNSYRQINNSLNFGATKDFVRQLNVF